MNNDPYRRILASPFNPENDGIDHINIYSQGHTLLGRRLTNFAYIPFNHPYYGHFCSMEGFWYYLRNGCQDEGLRSVSGMAAKNLGRTGKKQLIPNFQDEIIGAIYQKIIQTPTILPDFINSVLPFAHYYVFGEETRQATGSDWMVDGFESLRNEMKQGKVPMVWQRCEARYREWGEQMSKDDRLKLGLVKMPEQQNVTNVTDVRYIEHNSGNGTGHSGNRKNQPQSALLRPKQ